jgi:hypothetical protein
MTSDDAQQSPDWRITKSFGGKKMTNRTALLAALALIAAGPALAQRPEGHPQREPNAPRANHGRVPEPPQKRAPRTAPEPERKDHGRVNSVPHVTNDHWYGHDRPDDKRYRVAHPFEHGHFAEIGASHRFRVERFDVDHHRFWFPGGFYFEIAPWDWAVASDWCWDCGDDYVVYDDPDHDGWYLVYNVHTGLYIHAQYMGS